MRARRAQARRFSTYFVKVFWRLSRSMVATRWPALSSATAMCIAVGDLPEPPFSFPRTITCAELETVTGAWSNIYATLDNGTISILIRRAVKKVSASRGDLFDRRWLIPDSFVRLGAKRLTGLAEMRRTARRPTVVRELA